MIRGPARTPEDYEEPRILAAVTYPIKSCAGILNLKPGARIDIQALGLRDDHGFMVIDRQDKTAVTQRERGGERLALAHPSIEKIGERRRLELRGPLSHEVSFDPDNQYCGKALTAQHSSGDSALVIEVSGAVSSWFSRLLDREVQLVRNISRVVGKNHGEMFAGTQASLADNAHILLASMASLGELNEVLEGDGSERVSMARFRPQLIANGCSRRAENSWRTIRLGNGEEGEDALYEAPELRATMPCDRCLMVDVHPGKGERNVPGGILKTLAQKGWAGDRRRPIFGERFCVTKPGSLRVGDRIHVLERKAFS